MNEQQAIELMDAKMVKQMLRCSIAWVYKAAENGVLPCVRIPCTGKGQRKKFMVRFKHSDILDFIEIHYHRQEYRN